MRSAATRLSINHSIWRERRVHPGRLIGSRFNSISITPSTIVPTVYRLSCQRYIVPSGVVPTVYCSIDNRPSGISTHGQSSQRYIVPSTIVPTVQHPIEIVSTVYRPVDNRPNGVFSHRHSRQGYCPKGCCVNSMLRVDQTNVTTVSKGNTDDPYERQVESTRIFISAQIPSWTELTTLCRLCCDKETNARYHIKLIHR